MQYTKTLWFIFLLFNSVNLYANEADTTLSGYVPYQTPSLKDWTMSNQTVKNLGGHTGHLQPPVHHKEHTSNHQQTIKTTNQQEPNDGQ